jgi:tetratricopeptide (TPR) repeat protein
MPTRSTKILALACLLPLLLAVGGCEKLEKLIQRGDEMSVQQLAEKHRDAVYQVVVLDEAGRPDSTGTAFAVNDSGLLVTNYHVVKFAKRIQVISSSRDKHLAKEVVAFSIQRDLAVLQLPKEARTPSYVTLAPTAEVKPGAKVTVIGGPLGLQGSVSEGIVSGVRQMDDPDIKGTYIQVTAPISPGSSGSPVFLMDGRVAGVATLNLVGGQQLNFAVPADDVALLIENQGKQDQRIRLRKDQEEANDPLFKDPAFPAALQAYKGGRLPEALTAFGALIKKYPRSASGHGYVADILRRDARYQDAIKFHQKALSLRKDVGWLWASYAKTLQKEQHYPQARQCYEKALELDQSDPETYAGLAEVQVAEKLGPQAIQNYTMALQADQENLRWWKALARAQMQERKFEDAIESWKHVLDRQPDPSSLMAARECARALGHDTRELDTRLAQIGQTASRPAPPPAKTAGASGKPAAIVTSGTTKVKSGFEGSWTSPTSYLTISGGGTFSGEVRGISISGTWKETGPRSAETTLTSHGNKGRFTLDTSDTLSAQVQTSKGTILVPLTREK